MKKTYLTIAMLLVLVALSVYGCGSTTTIIQQAPTTVYTPPTTTTTIQTFTQPPSSNTWTWPSPGNIMNGGTYAYFPLNGAYIQINGTKTLTMSWSADGGLDCFILTENQFNNFKNDIFGIVSAWLATGSGSSGTITAVVQNTDTYYVVLRNTFSLGSPVKLYQATLTAR